MDGVEHGLFPLTGSPATSAMIVRQGAEATSRALRQPSTPEGSCQVGGGATCYNVLFGSSRTWIALSFAVWTGFLMHCTALSVTQPCSIVTSRPLGRLQTGMMKVRRATRFGFPSVPMIYSLVVINSRATQPWYHEPRDWMTPY